MGSGRQSTFWAPSEELGPMMGEALEVIGNTAYDKGADVQADMHFRDGFFLRRPDVCCGFDHV